MGRAIGYSPVDASDMALACVDRAAASILKPPIGTVLAREDGCVASFSEAKKRGIRRIYQLPTAYFETVRNLMAKEAELFPGLCASEEFKDEFSEIRNERKSNELSLCDAVLCPSAFVLSTLPAGPCRAKSLKVIPFGFDPRLLNEENDKRDPLFLYAGNISVRKGIHRLLRAWKMLRAHQTHKLLLVGDMQLTDSFLNDFRGVYEHKPRLPFSELQEIFRRARAFVFNAMADGFGLVISEAMCASTPVLASRNCGAPDVIRDGVEGRLFDYADDDALAQALDWALGHPSDLRAMGRNASKRAASWTWDEHRKQFIEWICSLPVTGD
jgi:glycosyltransferase involved in cell wall biosynthesis